MKTGDEMKKIFVIVTMLILLMTTTITVAAHTNQDALICISIPGDTNSDGRVDTTDLLNVINNWGDPPFDPPGSDVNDDGVVNTSDLLIVINNWTS
jgi:hypothetical protein